MSTQATPRDSAYGTAPLTSLESSPVESGDNGQAPARNPRKRPREDEIDDDNDRAREDGDGDGGAISPVAKKVAYVFAGQITIPPLCVPKSQYRGYKYPMPIEKEFRVLETLLAQESDVDSNASSFDFYSYQLEEFSMYYPDCRRLRCEMAALSNLSVKAGEALMLFDGVLTNGKESHYVEGVPFCTLSIGNYQKKTEHDVVGKIWIQTDAAARGGAWYELGSPSREYERYYTPFLWLANFSKHLIDYLDDRGEIEGINIELSHFKEDFAFWIKKHHSTSLAFQKWHEEYGRDDFRQAVAAHRDWLWNQVHITENRMTRHPFWDEVLHISAVEEKGVKEPQTVVTRYVHSCFKHMFGHTLKVVEPVVAPRTAEQGTMFMDSVAVTKPVRAERDQEGFIRRPRVPHAVEVGQVVAIRKDSGTAWTSQSNTWFAYIQRVRHLGLGLGQRVAIDVIWIYSPEDTVLSLERYPYQNELFFSDHCNCGESTLYTSDIVDVVSVAFGEARQSEHEFFIRQKYRCQDPAFMTLKDEDLQGCECLRPKDSYTEVKRVFRCGDTALISAVRGTRGGLEPVEIVRFVDKSGMIDVRVLERRHRVDPVGKARPNELLWTSTVVSVKAECFYRRCYVRFVSAADLRAGKIPMPYDRHGTGDFFILSSSFDKNEGIKPFTAENFPPSLLQGIDLNSGPKHDKEIIGGMDLFCGGGNFGRGIEEGGMIKMKWAVDIDKIAIASYAANLRGGDKDVALYLGSINDYLHDAILGKYSKEIAAPAQVGFISAGSPCQGFSNANQSRDSIKSIKNCSLVASVATAIDVYRPLFGLLENVPGIATTIDRGTGEENVFSQLLCCLVGMGYQCQQFTLDAWSFGNPQSRTRLFLSIAAPGQTLPDRPPRSHEHPIKTTDRALFKAPNGKRFGGREMDNPCPFPCATFRQRLGDLPPLGNNHVGICIPFPDHRNSRIEGPETRTLISHVPKHKEKKSWRSALNSGVMPKQFDLWKMSAKKGRPHCRSWSRMSMDSLCKTITTTITPQCAFTGTWIHPEEDRLITVMEARRAQGLPDDEVLIGNAAQAFKIVGNGVARSVALVWGLAIRNAYLGENHILKR